MINSGQLKCGKRLSVLVTVIAARWHPEFCGCGTSGIVTRSQACLHSETNFRVFTRGTSWSDLSSTLDPDKVIVILYVDPDLKLEN